ncbi:two-component system, sensor histidine kinase and response regulator [Gammaproteobacteria bacterium]
MINLYLHSTLERRLAIYVGLGTMFFALIVGELAYFYFFSRGVANAWALEKQLVQTVTSQAAVGAFAQNEPIAQEVIQGLLINPLILGARIESNEGFKAERTKKVELNFSTAASHPLPSPINSLESTGELKVIIDLDAVQNAATAEAMNYAGLMVVQIIVAASILMTMFRRLLGRPITTFAKRMMEINPGDGIRLPIEAHRVHDEIGLLSRSANALLDATDRAIHEERNIRQRLAEANDALQREIEERGRAEVALRIQEEQYRLISENMIDLICLLTPDSRFLYISPSSESMLGYDPRELLDKPFVELVHPDDIKNYFKITSDSGGSTASMVYRLRAKNGNYIWVESLIKQIFDETGVVVRLQSVSRDVTERERITLELRQARQTAEKASQIKGEFLATMSHEIRTPMNAIIGLIDLALRLDPPKKLESYLKKIQYASHSLLRIINDILNFSKIEAGKLILESVDFNLRNLFDNLGNMFRQGAADKEIELNLVIDNGTPCQLIGDPTRLEQILINLIGNALKFTKSGEVMVRVFVQEKTIQQANLEVMIRDSGIGMTTEQIAALFNPFSQADGSITRQYGGTGLGLSICKRLVTMMNGKIWVESIKNKGSTFHFTAIFGIQEKMDELDKLKKSLPQDIRNLHVLVVDDNESARLTLKESLYWLEHPPTIIASGKIAVAEMRSAIESGTLFDLILMDQGMPEMDGIETAQQLLEISLLTDELPKVIMLTTFSNQELILSAKKIGIDILLQKPIDNSMLLNAIMETFNKDGIFLSHSEGEHEETVNEFIAKLGGCRILLVEDNAINREVAREVLKYIGVIVEEANDGQEAIKMVQLAQYDAVLMDVQMPTMDGITATRLIRRDSRFQDLPIIAMTAHAMADARNESLAAGMNDHVTKPIDQRELFNALTRWVKPRQEFIDVRSLPSQEVQCFEKEKTITSTSVPGIDLSGVLKRLNHNSVFLSSILAEFARNYLHAAEDLRKRLQDSHSDNISSALHLVHTIKGVAGNISAPDLFKAALSLEIAIKDKRCEDWPTLLNDFTDALTVVLCSIKKINNQETEDTTVRMKEAANNKAMIIDFDMVIPLLNKLSELLADNDSEAQAIFDTVKSFLAKDFDELAQIETYIDQFDYKGAQSLLTELKKRLFVDNQ